MQKKILWIGIFILLSGSFKAIAQYSQQDSTYKKCFVGSSGFMLGNLFPKNRPDFIQLNFGYRMTRRDAVSIELKTWKYAWPLGIPFGKSFEAPEEKYPGYIREFGFALAYQRYLWKGLFFGVHVMNAWQHFADEDGHKIDKGFQIFNTYRVGYHLKLFKDRWFIQPSIAVTHRPYQTKMTDSFKSKDDRWPKYFIGEPGLHFGFNF